MDRRSWDGSAVDSGKEEGARKNEGNPLQEMFGLLLT